MKDTFRLSLREANARMRTGSLRCADYTQSLTMRIQSLEDKIGVWAWLNIARAVDYAKSLDANPELKNRVLFGIPIAVKDVIDTEEIPTRMGSEIYADNVPQRSAPVIERLEQAGAFVMGKTVTAEFAFLSPGKTANPWNVQHTPGGSSSGSAVAVAAGFVPVALGTQTNGSVIRPAAFCGVVGYKPSQGLISNQGTLDYSPSLDQIGIFTRNVGDAAWFISAISPITEKIKHLNSAPRFAAIRSPVWALAQPEQQIQFEKDIAVFRRSGAAVIDTELDSAFDNAHQTHRRIMSYETGRYFAELRSTHRKQISEVLNRFIDEGNSVSEAEYVSALEQRRNLQRLLARFLNEFDAIITPPATGEAPKTLEHTGDPSFCTIWTLCGVPAISIPTGLGPSGLPLGLQIISSKDDRLLEVASWCEYLIDFEALHTRT